MSVLVCLLLVLQSPSPSPWLPDLLEFENGTKVSSRDAWLERRAEVLMLAQTTFLGTFPESVPPVTSASVVNRTAAGAGVECIFATCTFDVSDGGVSSSVSFPIEILSPTAGAPKPIFMTQWNHRMWAVAGVARGYIGVIYPGSDAKDFAPEFQKAYPNSTMALIAARAWLGSRTVDCLHKLNFGKTDLNNIAVTGHSRNGKQSLIFAAIDERIGAVVGSSPGAPIAAPYRFTSSNFYGEGPRTGHVTCGGAKWWLCSSLKYDGHPELMPMDGHGIVGAIAPRFAAIATGHQDQASDMVFAGEMNIRAASAVYKLLGVEGNLRNIYRYGQHHGFDDITTYFDWFDHAFGLQTSYANSLIQQDNGRTADGLLHWYQTWLTPAGFDWNLWNSTAVFDRTVPSPTAPLANRVNWLLALGASEGELGVFSMGATYSEESEGFSYIPGMMGHVVEKPLMNQPFAFGDYISAQAYWLSDTPVSPDKLQPCVIWLHPYSYNTGYTPSYMGSKAWSDIAKAGFIVMAYDQIGFGIRNTQGGNRFYSRHGGNASLLGAMVKDARAAVDFMLCRSPLRNNDTLCSQHGYSASNRPIDLIPYIDPNRIYAVGYSLGGMVALHATALDSRISAVGAFAAFTPFRSDSVGRPTGGLRRLSEMHALLPRLGAFINNTQNVPYDYDELLSAVAPRPTLLYTPQGDRDATYEDVKACIDKISPLWNGTKSKLTHLNPDTVTKFESAESIAAIMWLKSLP